MTKEDIAHLRAPATTVARGRELPTMWVTSSGTSGRPTYWPRGLASLAQGEELFDRLFGARTSTGSGNTLVVVCFAMGTWTGGTYALLGLVGTRARGRDISVVTPGIDLDAALDAMATLGPLYDKVVLAGYPPYVRDVLDRAPEHVLRQNIHLFVGGESTSETWRDYVLKRIGRVTEPARVLAGYGSSDTGFVGCETSLTVAVRRAARTDHALATALFGRCAGDHTTMPTLVEYDPELCFVQTDVDGYLLFTLDGITPLIRYRVNDRGEVIDSDRFAETLRSTGHRDLADIVPPGVGYLLMYGRTDVAAIYCSANIYPDPIRAALYDSTVSEFLSGKFILDTIGDDHGRDTLRLRVEARQGTASDTVPVDRVRAVVVDSLIRTNSEYRILHERLGATAEPVIVTEPFGTAEFTPGIKHREVGTTG
ncbi:phenylacetate--CoA ligase family protein [Nocardia noduli]|uniref:phenylacetate--CoA ligase family protein n=1 Tax=Nocardia noduli TaxID=2815722 RepID=UPI001C240158|nr:phenylacetate--CoA ligase family protein [Nocardia noduli]